METLKKIAKKIWESEALLKLRCTGMGLGMFAVLFLGLIPLMLIFLNANRLKGLWLPLMLAYFALFAAPTGWLIRRKKLREQRFLIGDELFFQLHPGEYRREQRIKRRRGAAE